MDIETTSCAYGAPFYNFAVPPFMSHYLRIVTNVLYFNKRTVKFIYRFVCLFICFICFYVAEFRTSFPYDLLFFAK